MTEQYAYLPNFRFMLRVNGIDVPLKSVAAFQRENEYDYIQEGGMNDYVYLRRKPISKPFTLRVERYVPTDFDDPLSNGTELLLPLLLFVGRNSGGKMGFGRYYVFTGAVVMGKEYGGLDSERGGLLTETITIGYNQMFCITNADDDEDDKEAWKFAEEEGDATSVNISRKYSKTPKEPLQNKMNMRAFKASAQKWEFDGTKKGGKGTISHTPLNEDGEMDKADMIDKRRHFSFAATFNPLAEADMNSKRSAVNASDESFGIQELSKDEMIEKAKMFELTPDGSVGGNGVIFAPKNIEKNKANEADFIKNAKLWKFDDDKKDGNGVHSTQNSLVTNHITNPDGSSTGLGRPELSEEEMAKKTKRWKFNGTSKAGTGASNTQNNHAVLNEDTITSIGPNEATKDKLKEQAKKWQFDEKTKAGTGTSSSQNNKAILSPDTVTSIGQNEASKETVSGKAKKWKFSEKTKAGNGVSSSQNNKVILNEETITSIGPQESSKDTLKGKAKKWEFDEKTKAGNGISNSQSYKAVLNENTKTTIGPNESSKDKLETLAKKWEFSEDTKAGKGTSSSQNNKAVLNDSSKNASIGAKEESQKTLEGKAQKWEFKDDTKAGAGVSSSQNSKAVLNDNSKNASIGAKEESQKTLEGKAKKWKFDKDSKTGNGVSSSQNSKVKLNEGTVANIGPKEESIKTLEGKAKKWKFDKDSKAGNGVSSSQNSKAKLNEDTVTSIGPNELPMETLANKANRWEFDGTSKAGGGESSRNTGKINELSKEQMAKKAQRGMTTNKAIADFLMK